MEELDLLKKAWKKDGNAFEQLSEQDLYKMVHQKSSSIVRWILVISLIEFVAWNSLTFLLSDDQYQAFFNKSNSSIIIKDLIFFSIWF